MKNLIIVESPTKAKTIHKYLGNDYTIVASFGHVCDLPSKTGSVDPQNHFHMIWESTPKAKQHIQTILKISKTAETIYLATDPDREGEAIAWHIFELLIKKNIASQKKIHRITFNSVTKNSILEALKSPRNLEHKLIDAYLARRALDYLVGFNLSPVLWRKLPGSRSAGRVQSVCLRFICEREQEIRRFQTQEYWTIHATFITHENNKILAKLTHYKQKKLQKFSIPDEKTLMPMLEALEQHPSYTVFDIQKKQRQRSPSPPFTTATLQQEAARKLYFSTKKTMQIAQSLYEGINIGTETTGLITYMRTDAVQISFEALNQIRSTITTLYTEKFLPSKPRFYKTKAKNAQEAHEAIRPANFYYPPRSLTHCLSKDELSLYTLIWNRTLASQMENAIYNQTSIFIADPHDQHIFHASGSVIVFQGFLKLYDEQIEPSSNTIEDISEEDHDLNDPNPNGPSQILPPVTKTDVLTKEIITPKQCFTQPPARYSEASLVKIMEELGIGRPSTYASTLSVLQDRNYVRLEKRQFIPEDRGKIVTAFLSKYFTQYVQYDFTANLEKELDLISEGTLEWKNVLENFWLPFTQKIHEVQQLRILEIIDCLNEFLQYDLFPMDEKGQPLMQCPKCQSVNLSLKLSRFGAFLGCTNYPQCDYSKTLDQNQEDSIDNNVSLGIDPQGCEVFLKKGPYGAYLQLGTVPQGKAKKPKRVTLPKTLSADDITLEKALVLLALPREIGIYPDTEEIITANIGPYGPYLKVGSHFVSLPAQEDILEINHNKAVLILTEKLTNKFSKELGTFPKKRTKIILKSGRYGFFLQYGRKKYYLPKNLSYDPKEFSLQDALTLIETKEVKQDS